MDDTDFQAEDWRQTLRAREAPAYKRALYSVMRPFLSANARRYLGAAARAEFRPDAVYFTRGTPHDWRRRWGARGTDIGSATILVQGTGTGWDVVGWAAMRPKKIVATDLFALDDAWASVSDYCAAEFGVEVSFHAAPLEDHGFLPDGSIDLCTSNAVFEHCRDLPAVLAESRRLLRAGGRLYACYGPMWFAPGGDHFSGRDGLEHAYNHVLLERGPFQAYFEKNKNPVEDFQSGGRFWELDLFSRMTTRDYLAAYDDAGFNRDGLVIELAPEALEFRKRWPEKWRALRDRYAGVCTEDDFAIKSNFVRLIRPRG